MTPENDFKSIINVADKLSTRSEKWQMKFIFVIYTHTKINKIKGVWESGSRGSGRWILGLVLVVI